MARSDVTRRKALRSLATGALGVAAGGSWVESLTLLAHQQAHTHPPAPAAGVQGWKPTVLTAHQNDTVVVLAELIIPTTDTPGAAAAGVNRFIDGVLQKAAPSDRASFLRGLSWIDGRSRTMFKTEFIKAAAGDQQKLLTMLSTVSGDGAAQQDRAGVDFFRALKSMTIDGYYTSEIGLRQELGDDGQLFHVTFAGCDHAEHL